MKNRATLVKTVVIIFTCVLLAVSAYVLIKGWIGGYFESVETLRAYIASYGMWGPVVLTLLQGIQVVFPVLPGFLGCIVGAALFGTAGGFWINYIGISAGSIVAYYLARRYGMQLVSKMVSVEKHEKFIEWINKSKSYTLVFFLSILLPLAPDDFLCYFSGVVNMPPKKFLTIIIVGKPWCILFYSIFFSYFI